MSEAVTVLPVMADLAGGELIAVRVSWPRRIAYTVSITVVAVVAAWNSYWHIVSVAVRGHQDPLLAYSLPASVDGLMLVASLAIAEDKAHGRRPRGWARFGFWLGALVSVGANMASVVVHYGLDVLSIAVAAWPPVALLVVVEIMSKPGKVRAPRGSAAGSAPPTALRHSTDVHPPVEEETSTTSAKDDLATTIGELRPADVAAVAGLIQPAINAATELSAHGQTLTRDTLSDRLREAGYAISNARVSALLKIVRAASTPGREPQGPPREDQPTSRSEASELETVH
jgi:hypothetical protein